MEREKVLTVLGPLAPNQMAITLMHEHILIDLRHLGKEPEEASLKALHHAPVQITNLGEIRWAAYISRDNLCLFDVDIAIDELKKYRMAGGETIVDVTPFGLGRDPRALQRIARETGVHIVAGCGYYIESAHPKDMSTKTDEEIADEIVREFQQGIGTTSVRPGIIGEIGTSYPITPNETKSLRGAALAQQRTGAAITVHLHPWYKGGSEVLDILERAGADLERVILGHLNPTLDDLDYHVEIARRGAYVEYDLFGYEFCIEPGRFAPRDWESVKAIKELIHRGFLKKLLISQDVCVKAHLTRFGGWGYAHILNHVVDLFHSNGVSEAELEEIMVKNPRRILPLVPARAC